MRDGLLAGLILAAAATSPLAAGTDEMTLENVENAMAISGLPGAPGGRGSDVGAAPDAPGERGETPPRSIEPPPAPPRQSGPRVDIAFLVDTTGSMGGLIEGAKKKIWAIANRVVSGKPTPQVRIALIAYRDRGDEYVTQVHDFTDDIDAVHGRLKTFTAYGGGDTPEDVNQALSDALHRLSWESGDRVLRLAFLVGDAPPHEEYGSSSVELAGQLARAGITVNTVRCGRIPETAAAWQRIAEAAHGEHTSIAQDGGMVHAATPMDAELARLNARLASTMVGYGTRDEREASAAKASAAMALDSGSAAERAAFTSKARGASAYGDSDLVSAVDEGRVSADALSAKDLPDELSALGAGERRARIAALSAARREITRRIAELSRERETYLAERTASAPGGSGADAFDDWAVGTIRRQARDVGIAYE
jgi:hypothetical protein